MRQEIKVIRVSSWEGAERACDALPVWAEQEVMVAWEAATSPDGVRPGLEAVYPLGDGLVLLVFNFDLPGVTLKPRPQEVRA